MLDLDLIKKRSLKKVQKRYGLSVVYGMPLHNKLINQIKIIRNLLPLNLINCFDWQSDQCLHMTILRCKSARNNFVVFDEQLAKIQDVFQLIPRFVIYIDNIKLDSDGVIRVYFSLVPELELISEIDTDIISKITNLNYSLITSPWITVANCNYIDSSIKLIDTEYFEINKILKKKFEDGFIEVNYLRIVKYEDTYFDSAQILHSLKLGERI